VTAFRTRHSSARHLPGLGRRRVGWRLIVGTAHLLGRLIQGLAASAVLAALVGALPWALWHYIGWPLPDHLSIANDIQAVLLGPMTTSLLLDVLACLCWITWAAFVIDVVRCALAAARGLRWPQLHTGGPVHTVAAILVGVIVLSLLGSRATPGAGVGITEFVSGHGVLVATAPVDYSMAQREQPVAVVNATLTVPVACADASTVAPSTECTVIVRAPENGIHDSLSRIAERTFRDAMRWPEIFEANKGKPQPNGGTLNNPNLIFPGERLVLPLDISAAEPPGPASGHHRRTPSTAPTSPTPPPLISAPTTPPSSPLTSPHAAPATTPRTGAPQGSGPGTEWEPGLFVGLGLAAAVSAALVAARRRYRRRYQPGSGRRDDLPVAPVVYQLRLVHLRAEHAATGPDGDPDDSGGGGNGPATGAPPLVATTPPVPDTPDGGGNQVWAAPGLGVHDGREVALDLAVARGLGLAGPGAAAAARALLLSMLAQQTPGPPQDPAPPVGAVQVIAPIEDLELVLGREHTHARWPNTVRVVADLDAALDELEAELLSRARQQHPASGAAWPVVALVARPPTHNTQRLQAVLDNGAHLGLVGVLLGQWRPGVSAYIRANGTVSATSPGLGEALRGTRMFHMPQAETADLLALLHQAQPDTPDHLRPSAVEVSDNEGPPLPSAQPQAGNGRTTLDGHDRAIAGETALEVIAFPSAEPKGIGPRRVSDLVPHRESEPVPLAGPGSRPPSHGHDPLFAQHITAAPECSPVAPGHHDVLAPMIALTVLGRPRVHWTPNSSGETREGGTAKDAARQDITGAFPPRQRELLVFLALHPDGVHRDVLVTALWEDNPPQRPTNALNTTLSRLRRSLSDTTSGAVGDIITVGEGRYQLDPSLVDVDYWRLRNAVANRRAASTSSERIAAYRRVVDCYGGCLAEGMDTEWIDAAREATRRDAIDAVAALARALVDSDPQHTLDLLETARAFDPHNELLYRDIMRLQERLGQLDAIPRTLALLTTRLAEIDETPTAHTLGLATRLQQRHNTADAVHTPSRHDPQADRRGTAAAI
jgi:DNA-binding SARP family transcriptional activator